MKFILINYYVNRKKKLSHGLGEEFDGRCAWHASEEVGVHRLENIGLAVLNWKKREN